MRLIIAFIVAFGLAGCSTSPDSMNTSKRVVDEDYVAMIENSANYNSSRVEVIWVNPPTRVVKKDNELKQ